MDNKLQATIDIGSMSCIMLIAAFESTQGEEGQDPRQVLVPKLQKVKICKPKRKSRNLSPS